METDAPKSPESNRRWYVRHFFTFVVLVIVGGALASANTLSNFVGGAGSLHYRRQLWLHGWPRLCVRRSVHSEIVWGPASSTRTQKVTSVSYSFTDTVSPCVDVIVGLAILVSTGVVCERFRRNWTWRLQFRLATLLWLTAVAAALFSLMRIVRSGWLGFEPNSIFHQPLWVRMAMLFGIGCTVYVAGQIGARIVGKSAAKVSRILTTR